MSDAEILKKAIEKAVKNGYPSIWSEYMIENSLAKDKIAQYGLVFNHPFAKAFWGEIMFICPNHNGESSDIRITCDLCDYSYRKEWQVHLQQMVLEEEPIKYLEKFL